MASREEGFTLVEVVIVLVLMAILLVIAVGFNNLARERAGDATARANIRVAIPAIESYRADAGTYAGMTVPILQTSYSPGVQGIEVLAADATGYCVRATAAGQTWYQNGPGAPITTTACS